MFKLADLFTSMTVLDFIEYGIFRDIVDQIGLVVVSSSSAVAQCGKASDTTRHYYIRFYTSLSKMWFDKDK